MSKCPKCKRPLPEHALAAHIRVLHPEVARRRSCWNVLAVLFLAGSLALAVVAFILEK